MGNELTTRSIDHLGLVSGMFDELELVSLIDSLILQDLLNRNISIGIACKALVINGLGFTQRTLYLVSSFYANKPIETLLGPGIESSHLNDSVLGRCLDDIHKYGTTKLFSEISPQVFDKLNLPMRFAHMDSTTFCLQGDYNADSPPDADQNILHLTRI